MMWQGKPVSEWTEEKNRQFFYLLTGEEIVWYCTPAEIFFIIKEYMEKELPEVWEGYLIDADYEALGIPWDFLDHILDLTNLIQHLLDNQEGLGENNPALIFAEGVE
jgi:hypothetical protein